MTPDVTNKKFSPSIGNKFTKSRRKINKYMKILEKVQAS